MASRQPLRALALLLALVLFAACGDDDSADEAGGQPAATTEAAPADTTEAPTSTTSAADETTATTGAPAEGESLRIISLSPTATEMLFAIDAGDLVIAADAFSNYPPEAPTTELSGFQPNVEAIAELEPDVVVMSGAGEDVIAGLEAVGSSVVILPAAVTLDDSYAQITELGALTGREAEAADVVAGMQADIDALVAEVDPLAGLTYFHELDDTYFSATSQTFIGQIYGLLGLTNIADAADPDGEAFGFPQLSPEFIIDADPDLIFLADTKCCGQDATTVAARPGWGGLSAVENGNVVELDDDIASRWGPRVVDFLEVVVEATAGVAVPVG